MICVGMGKGHSIRARTTITAISPNERSLFCAQGKEYALELMPTSSSDPMTHHHRYGVTECVLIHLPERENISPGDARLLLSSAVLALTALQWCVYVCVCVCVGVQGGGGGGVFWGWWGIISEGGLVFFFLFCWVFWCKGK